MNRSELQEFTSWLGKRSYRARLKRLGLTRLQEIARENGRKGGRPKGSGGMRGKGTQKEADHGAISTKV